MLAQSQMPVGSTGLELSAETVRRKKLQKNKLDYKVNIDIRWAGSLWREMCFLSIWAISEAEK